MYTRIIYYLHTHSILSTCRYIYIYNYICTYYVHIDLPKPMLRLPGSRGCPSNSSVDGKSQRNRWMIWLDLHFRKPLNGGKQTKQRNKQTNKTNKVDWTMWFTVCGG